MTEYQAYLAFCKDRGYLPYAEEDIFWRANWRVRRNPGDYDDETA